MLNKFSLKRSKDFDFTGNHFTFSVNGKQYRLEPRDIESIQVDEDNFKFTLGFGVDKVVIEISSADEYCLFCKKFYDFFTKEDFLFLRRKIIKKLLGGSIVIIFLASLIGFFYYDRFRAVVYLLAGVVVFSFYDVYLQIRNLNTFFSDYLS